MKPQEIVVGKGDYISITSHMVSDSDSGFMDLEQTLHIRRRGETGRLEFRGIRTSDCIHLDGVCLDRDKNRHPGLPRIGRIYLSVGNGHNFVRVGIDVEEPAVVIIDSMGRVQIVRSSKGIG